MKTELQTNRAMPDSLVMLRNRVTTLASQTEDEALLADVVAMLNGVRQPCTYTKEEFAEALKDMVARYPDSELATMSKDMLAMMGQGMESQTGGAVSTLADKREELQNEEEQSDAEKTFSAERDEPSYVLLLYPKQTETLLKKQKEEEERRIQDELNNLQYEVALFNFTRFLIRDFDLTTLPAYPAAPALRVSGLDNMDEAQWYIGLLMESEEIKAIIADKQIRIIPITETNNALIGNGKTMEEYEEFIGDL